MSDLKLSLPERALLLILLAENAELSNKEIAEKYAPGLALTGKNRLRLIDAKLIECRREGRSFVFSLADEGWRWGRAELTRDVPRGSGAAGQALYAVLKRLENYLEQTALSLAQVFGPQLDGYERPAAAAAPGEARPAPDEIRPAADQARPAADEIEKRIRRAYRELADPAGSWVGLADLREQLTGIAKADVDGVLRLLARLPGLLIEEETNQKGLTARDREAAVVIGQRAHHVLMIEEL